MSTMFRKSVSGTWHYATESRGLRHATSRACEHCQTNGIGIISRNDSPMRHMRQKGCGDNTESEEDDE